MNKWDKLNKKLEKIGSKGAVGTHDVHLSTGIPNLDWAISGKYRGGGVLSSRMVEIFGPESSGKTQISTNLMIQAQKAGGVGIFVDHERTFDEHLAVNFGLDNTDGPFIYRKPRTFEESIDTVHSIITTIREADVIDFKAPIAIIWDSLAQMVPQSKIDKNAADYNMNDNSALARATSAAFPALSLIIEENNALGVFINQVRKKIGVSYGDPTTTPGGDAMKFHASLRLQLSRQMVKSADGKILGQRITANSIKNKTYRPFVKTAWDFRFKEDGSGYIDPVLSMINHMIDNKLFDKDGAKYVWGDKSYMRGHFINAVKRDPDALEKLIVIAESRGVDPVCDVDQDEDEE